jgi:hypothetical protein
MENRFAVFISLELIYIGRKKSVYNYEKYPPILDCRISLCGSRSS